jgi:cytochrome P450
VFEQCARRYGDPFLLQVMLAGNLVYTADPGVVREVFKADPHQFHAGDAYILMEPVGGPTSIFLLDEERHLRMRRLLLPQFHGELLKRWRPVIEQMTVEEIERWPRGTPFPLRPRTEAITLEVIMRIVFGIRESERAVELRDLLPRLFAVNLLQAPSFVYPKLRRDLGPRSPWGKFLRLRGRIDELLYEEIRQRREMLAGRTRAEAPDAAGAPDPAGPPDPSGPPDPAGPPDDILTLLLSVHDDDGRGLTDDELRDQLITMLLAGHETTSSALAWAFERLLRTPAALGRLQDEVERGEGEYMDAVIKETLRIRPVAAHVARQLQVETEIAGYRLPRRTVIAPSIYLIHRNPRLYPDPGAFRPERFLGEDPPDHYGWIPFGGGVRRCLGASLATLEMQVVISTILRSVRLRAARAKPEGIGVLGVTLVPARGAEVIAG